MEAVDQPMCLVEVPPHRGYVTALMSQCGSVCSSAADLPFSCGHGDRDFVDVLIERFQQESRLCDRYLIYHR